MCLFFLSETCFHVNVNFCMQEILSQFLVLHLERRSRKNHLAGHSGSPQNRTSTEIQLPKRKSFVRLIEKKNIQKNELHVIIIIIIINPSLPLIQKSLTYTRTLMKYELLVGTLCLCLFVTTRYMRKIINNVTNRKLPGTEIESS